MPGMYSRRGFLRKLRKMATERRSWFVATRRSWSRRSIGTQAFARKCGETASHSLVNTAARAIKRVAGENAVSAYLGDGRFATLLGGPVARVGEKRRRVCSRRDFGSRESHHESIPRPPLTSAVVPWSAGNNADRFLNDALETLELAEHSGGGCVMLHGEFSKELAAWKEEMSAGNPFANVVAQDIMEPFPAFLQLRRRTERSGRRASQLRGFPCGRMSIATGDWSVIAVDEHAAGEVADRSAPLA